MGNLVYLEIISSEATVAESIKLRIQHHTTLMGD